LKKLQSWISLAIPTPAHVAKVVSYKIALTRAKIQKTTDKVRSFFGERDKKLEGILQAHQFGAIGTIGLLMTFVQEYRRSENSDNAKSFTQWADHFKTVGK
jgi:hypothetical protein